MPTSPKRECAAGGCRTLTHGRYCELHERQKGPQQRQKSGWHRGARPKISSSRRLYNHKWQKYSQWFLSQPENLYCCDCLNKGKYVRATATDHIQPHDDDLDLFWDEKNHQGLCRSCHARKSAIERHGKTRVEQWHTS